MKQVNMSFGVSCSDVTLLVQLAWTTVRNSRKACGEHAELTRRTTSLHVILQRLEREIAKPESPINRPGDTCILDLAPIISGCKKALGVLDRILKNYNALSDGERSGKKLWKAVRFGNGESANVEDLQLKLAYHTSDLSLFLNTVCLGSMGVVEKQTYEILRGVDNITAHFMSGADKEGSVLTDYADDDKAFWRELRRELVREGFSSDVIRERKDTIKAYVKELGSKGIFDDDDLKDFRNIPEEIEDTKPTQATPEPRDEAMGLFEGRSGTARDAVSPRTATTAHIDNLFGTGNGEPRENGTVSQKTQIESAHLTISNVLDTPPHITQADAEINSVAESDSREVEKVDDRTNRHQSSAPISLGQSLPEVAEEDTWYKGPFDFRPTPRYYEYHYNSRKFLYIRSANHAEDFEDLSSPLLARRTTLGFQAEAKGFLKMAELRTELWNSRSGTERKSLLKLSSLFHDPDQGILFGVLLVIDKGHPNNIMNGLMQWCLRSVDACPEKWRIKEWPLHREETEREGHEDRDKGKRSTSTTFSTEEGQAHAPPAASASVEDIQDPSSTTEESETDDDQSDDSSHNPWIVTEKRGWQGLANEANSIREKRRKQQELKARSIRKEKMRSMIQEEKNTDWLGPSRDRASSLGTTDLFWADVLEKLTSMGITEDQIEQNADFIRDYIQQKEASEDHRTKRKRPFGRSALGIHNFHRTVLPNTSRPRSTFPTLQRQRNLDPNHGNGTQ